MSSKSSRGIPFSQKVLTVVSEVETALQKWMDQSALLKNLANQIMALEKCDKNDFELSPNVFEDAKQIIISKIEEHLKNLEEVNMMLQEGHSNLQALDFVLQEDCNKSLLDSFQERLFLQYKLLHEITKTLNEVINVKKFTIRYACSQEYTSILELDEINSSHSVLEDDFRLNGKKFQQFVELETKKKKKLK